MDIKKFIIEVLESWGGKRVNTNLFKKHKIKDLQKLYPQEFETIQAEVSNCQGNNRNLPSYNEAIYRLRHEIKGVVMCQECQTPVKFHTYGRGYHKFCSPKCSAKNSLGNTKIERVCDRCGTPFVATNASKHHCSEKCRLADRHDRSLDRPYHNTNRGIKIPRRDALKILDSVDCCEICGTPFITERNGEQKRNKWKHLDHNHKTGKIRGVLCGHCNSGLGMFRDNPELLQAAVEYLKRTDGE